MNWGAHLSHLAQAKSTCIHPNGWSLTTGPQERPLAAFNQLSTTNPLGSWVTGKTQISARPTQSLGATGHSECPSHSPDLFSAFLTFIHPTEPLLGCQRAGHWPWAGRCPLSGILTAGAIRTVSGDGWGNLLQSLGVRTLPQPLWQVEETEAQSKGRAPGHGVTQEQQWGGHTDHEKASFEEGHPPPVAPPGPGSRLQVQAPSQGGVPPSLEMAPTTLTRRGTIMDTGSMRLWL